LLKPEEQISVTAKCYTEVSIPKVLEDIRIKLLLLHHNDTSSHTARLTKQVLGDNKIKIIAHHPYSSDLAMCDFWLFP